MNLERPKKMHNDASLLFYSTTGGEYIFLLNGFLTADKGQPILNIKLNNRNVLKEKLTRNVIIKSKLNIKPGWNKIQLKINNGKIIDNNLKVTKIKIKK